MIEMGSIGGFRRTDCILNVNLKKKKKLIRKYLIKYLLKLFLHTTAACHFRA